GESFERSCAYRAVHLHDACRRIEDRASGNPCPFLARNGAASWIRIPRRPTRVGEEEFQTGRADAIRRKTAGPAQLERRLILFGAVYVLTTTLRASLLRVS